MNARHAAVGVVSVVLAILGVRLSRHPLETYGDSAAQYIEHLARLRILERIDVGPGGGPLESLVALDGLYPPGLPLMELVWGAVWGHAAESVVWMGLVWWLLLCAAVGVLARRVDPGTPNAWAAGVIATALLPATQGMALRSYYDLPMTVLLWWAVAVLAGSGAWRGLCAGLLLVTAVLIKWTALPFGIVMIGAWMVFGDRDTRRQGATALSLMGLWTVVFLWAGAESLFTMGGATFQPPAGVVLTDVAGFVPGAPGRWLQAV